MKKVLLALFLMSGFVSADFTITDENGKEQSAFPYLELDIPTGSVQQYKINATNITSNTAVHFQNISGGNILMRFDAGATSNNQDGATSKNQIIYQVGSQDDYSTSDYYALSSCEVDNNLKNIPTRSFFIINNNETKWLKFSMRDCETGDIGIKEKLDLQTTLLAIRTQMSDNSVDPQNGSKAYGLPAVIIGEDTTTRDLRTKSATGKEEFLCGTANNIKSLELYDGSKNQVRSFSYRTIDGAGEKINFTIENRPGTNYRKMHLKLTCNNNNKEHLYYFDARPKEIRVSNLPNNEWLYAEQRYKSDDGTAYDDGFSNAIKQIGSLANCDNCKVVANSLESKTMKAITLTPVDAKGVAITDYNSIGEIAITGKIYDDDTNQNIINETNGNALIRPCVAGSRANCAIAIAEINGATSEIYTDIVNKTKVLAYNNVGPTVLYGADTEWTRYSQSQATPLCDKLKSHHEEINGLVGCNIPFVPEGGGDKDSSNELNFYSFKPAVYKMLFESKNSPANASYGTDKLTYIHTIKPDDYDATNNKIFEAADFNASILAIGASLESLKNNRTLSHYDNHLKVANKLEFSGNPANPTITINGSKTNDIADDFIVTVNNDETDISGAIMLTLEPNNPYNHKENYKANPTPTEITIDKNNITINSLKDKFYAGKNIKVNKLNLKREDLLARSYAHIGSSSVNIDMTKNADLNTKITTDKAAFISSYKGDDLNFVDAAIIAPNVASSEDTTDGAVYLAGYCESTTLTACKEIEVFISSAIAGHINYYGFDFLAYGNNPESTTDSLFEYSDATFSQFKRGADFLGGFTADKVTIMLKGDKAREYCNIFRNCYELETDKFGTTFNSYKASIRQWHGEGDQGKTIVDSINEAGKTTTRRKEQRLSF
ncbi:hypothetical protein PTQ33_00215 [Campylobacter sp. 50012-21]|uniref:hypothetical protein n=1 Tax=Campylobacter magnus TaxID=3026462 RepID=UPI00235F1278|nr:hypothetical protein [Campylobacter magnus]MDD0845552.1 hypothetical protein [Campylobacter magnus]